jgi:carboxyl-terminal processing protease
MTTRGLNDNQTFSARETDLAKGKPIAVLVNEGTASGAEVIAGALQDNHRATVIGLPTFGEGSVQSIIPVKGGGALLLTTSLLVRPSGWLIQEAGIEPDRLVSNTPHDAQGAETPNSYGESKLQRHIAGVGERGDSQPVLYPAPGSTGDFQLTTALALLDEMAP